MRVTKRMIIALKEEDWKKLEKWRKKMELRLGRSVKTELLIECMVEEALDAEEDLATSDSSHKANSGHLNRN